MFQCITLLSLSLSRYHTPMSILSVYTCSWENVGALFSGTTLELTQGEAFGEAFLFVFILLFSHAIHFRWL